MLVSRLMRLVAPAAAARVISESWVGNATRSMVARPAKPRSSARRAKATSSVPDAPGTGFGMPMPISIPPTLPGLRTGLTAQHNAGPGCP